MDKIQMYGTGIGAAAAIIPLGGIAAGDGSMASAGSSPFGVAIWLAIAAVTLLTAGFAAMRLIPRKQH